MNDEQMEAAIAALPSTGFRAGVEAARVDAAARALYKDYEQTTDEHVERVWRWSEHTDQEVRDSWEETVRDMRDWATKALAAADAVGRALVPPSGSGNSPASGVGEGD